ncbi:putative ATP-dependent zinc metalloprotease [Desulfosarcina variabilis str. Montpellier]|uniref:ATP-dependent metallopeptidase FtsH/Yme1/Tma family protein n=1 Tax=Desulfosarcina variabilis TaxID=2300 RepID=UPI003AFA7147
MNNQLPSSQPRYAPIKWQTIVWLLLLWMLVFYLFQGVGAGTPPRDIAYTQFKEKVRRGEVVRVVMRGANINGEMVAGDGEETSMNDATDRSANRSTDSGSNASSASSGNMVRFETVKPMVTDPGLMELLETNHVVVRAKLEQRSWFWSLIITLLPWVLIIGFFIYSNRKWRGRMGGWDRGALSGSPNPKPGGSRLNPVRPLSAMSPAWRMPNGS